MENLIPSCLSPDDLALFQPHLEHVDRPPRKVLGCADQRITAAYFPESAFASIRIKTGNHHVWSGSVHCKVIFVHRRSGLALLVLILAALFFRPMGAFALDTSQQAGRELFQEQCSPCHGIDATGNGPMAAALKVAPSDLTEISKRAGGVFPAARIVEIITFGSALAGHGSREMPIWGEIFSNDVGGGRRGAASSRRAVLELKRYLEAIQKK